MTVFRNLFVLANLLSPAKGFITSHKKPLESSRDPISGLTSTSIPNLSKACPQKNSNIVSLSAGQSVATEKKPDQFLTEKQVDFTLGYLNKHHSDLLAEFAKAFSSLGTEAAKKNAWSGGSYVIEKSEIVGINQKALELKITVQKRGESNPTIETVSMDLGTFMYKICWTQFATKELYFSRRSSSNTLFMFAVLQTPIPSPSENECMAPDRKCLGMKTLLPLMMSSVDYAVFVGS